MELSKTIVSRLKKKRAESLLRCLFLQSVVCVCVCRCAHHVYCLFLSLWDWCVCLHVCTSYLLLISKSVGLVCVFAGVHIINIKKTWEKLVLAARAIVAIENPADVCVISARPYGQRAVLKFASATGATPIAGRFTPGTFTNQIQVGTAVLSP